MTITYEAFLTRVIDEGIEAANQDYNGRKLDGAVDGFEACRGKLPNQFNALLGEARARMRPHVAGAEDFWYWRCYEAEVEWVMNVVSAMLVNEGKEPLMSYLPTASAFMKAASIVGVGALA